MASGVNNQITLSHPLDLLLCVFSVIIALMKTKDLFWQKSAKCFSPFLFTDDDVDPQGTEIKSESDSVVLRAKYYNLAFNSRSLQRGIAKRLTQNAINNFLASKIYHLLHSSSGGGAKHTHNSPLHWQKTMLLHLIENSANFFSKKKSRIFCSKKSAWTNSFERWHLSTMVYFYEKILKRRKWFCFLSFQRFSFLLLLLEYFFELQTFCPSLKPKFNESTSSLWVWIQIWRHGIAEIIKEWFCNELV